jgi:glutamate synthase domain-containing protein 3
VVILGAAGANLGAGMTGGLTYILRTREHDNENRLNHDSVRLAPVEACEELWLRRILQRHAQLTGSPRAAGLLYYSALPLMRVEPVTPPCSVEETWASILSRLAAEEARNYTRESISPQSVVVQ